MLVAGTSLGRYRIERLIGRGGMGEVYLAEDTHLRRKVAIKVIAPQADPRKLAEALRLFQREMQAIARLDHPYILPLYDYGEDTVGETKYTYMVMPFREDGTLESWLTTRKDKRAPFPSIEDVAQILSQAASALQAAHDDPAQILHLDVKLSNFLIRDNNEHPNYPDLLLADFGTTKIINATGDVTDTVRGSAAHMPPEQWQRNPQSASDQYALAVMIYEILTYQKPFQGTIEQVMYQHLRENPQPPSAINPRIPSEIDAVILKALAKNFQDRYPSITAFADAFKQALVSNADTRVLLSISRTEAQTGVAYPLTLPDRRRITVAIPAGVQDGQSIRQESMGESAYTGGPPRALLITIAVKPESENERVVLNRLQQLSQELQALRTNPPVDQRLILQLQQLTQEVTALKTQVLSNNPRSINQQQDVTRNIPLRQARPENKQNILELSTPLPPPVQDQGATSSYDDLPAPAAQLQSKQPSPQTDPPISANLPKSPITASSIRNRLTIKRPSNRTIIVLAILAILIVVAIFIVVSSGIYYVYSSISSTQAYPSYLPGSGTLVLSDKLDGASNRNNWDTTSGCNFSNGAYHVTNSDLTAIRNCVATTATGFANFAFEVTMSMNSGDCGGVTFRAGSSNTNYYSLQICQSGVYTLAINTDNTIANEQTLVFTSTGLIHQGLNQTNLIDVLANSNQLTFYINQQFANSVTDNTHHSRKRVGKR